MMVYQTTSDATAVYRDTAGMPIATANSAGDLGNTVAIMRNASVRVGAPLKVTRTIVVDRAISKEQE